MIFNTYSKLQTVLLVLALSNANSQNLDLDNIVPTVSRFIQNNGNNIQSQINQVANTTQDPSSPTSIVVSQDASNSAASVETIVASKVSNSADTSATDSEASNSATSSGGSSSNSKSNSSGSRSRSNRSSGSSSADVDSGSLDLNKNNVLAAIGALYFALSY